MTSLPLRLPLSTYRLQFNASFTFQDASRILPYLSQLGITDCYASPYLKAAPGSTHGYDVVDPTELNPEIGTEADYQAFIQALHHLGMGQILEVVPNHMGIAGSTNPFLHCRRIRSWGVQCICNRAAEDAVVEIAI